jgi:hypothetical protein
MNRSSSRVSSESSTTRMASAFSGCGSVGESGGEVPRRGFERRWLPWSLPYPARAYSSG